MELFRIITLCGLPLGNCKRSPSISSVVFPSQCHSLPHQCTNISDKYHQKPPHPLDFVKSFVPILYYVSNYGAQINYLLTFCCYSYRLKTKQSGDFMDKMTFRDVLNLKQNPLRESRFSVAEKICDQFNAQQFTREESFVALEVLRLLAKDVEVAIRQVIAEKLKHNKQLPEDIAFMLANDVMQVAMPILQFSPSLSENDLVAIVRTSSDLVKLLAVSKRDMVPSKISKELIQKKRLFVVESLVQNKGSLISDSDLTEVIQQYGGVDSLIKALIRRNQLSAVVVEKLLETVTGALRDQLLEKHHLHAHAIKEAAEDTKDKMAITHASLISNAVEKELLVHSMQQSKRLNPSIVIRSLCLGDLEFFVSSMATLTGWPHHRVEHAMKNHDIETLKRLYRAGGLPESIRDATLAMLLLVMEELRAGYKGNTPEFSGRIIERIVAAGYDRSVSNMSYLLTLAGKKPNVATYH